MTYRGTIGAAQKMSGATEINQKVIDACENLLNYEDENADETGLIVQESISKRKKALKRVEIRKSKPGW